MERWQNWASYLRDQAEELGIVRIDTSLMSVQQVAEQVELIVGGGSASADAVG